MELGDADRGSKRDGSGLSVPHTFVSAFVWAAPAWHWYPLLIGASDSGLVISLLQGPRGHAQCLLRPDAEATVTVPRSYSSQVPHIIRSSVLRGRS